MSQRFEHYTRNEQGHFVEVDEDEVLEHLISEEYNMAKGDLDRYIEWHENSSILGRIVAFAAGLGR